MNYSIVRHVLGLSILLVPSQSFAITQGRISQINGLAASIKNGSIKPDKIYDKMRELRLSSDEKELSSVQTLDGIAVETLKKAQFVNPDTKQAITSVVTLTQPPIKAEKVAVSDIPVVPQKKADSMIQKAYEPQPKKVTKRMGRGPAKGQQPMPLLEVAREETEAVRPFATNTLLVFLDGPGDKEKELGAISKDLALALLQEAGPIIASASFVVNVKKPTMPEGKSPEMLLQRFTAIEDRLEKNKEEVTEEEWGERTEILQLAVGLDAQSARKWIIKEISPMLYLFLPKNYVQTKKIRDKDVEVFNPQAPITATEQTLGLKVNHMKTVALDSIEKPDPMPAFATYFIDSLSAIFVLNSEYPKQNKGAIPTWAFYMDGHGEINSVILGLPLQTFKICLAFFEEKINTKLLYYTSCYAAGLNAEKLYANNKTGIYKTYPFVTITQALTDTQTVGADIDPYVEQGKLRVKIPHDCTDFIKRVTSSDSVDYRALVEPFVPNLQEEGLGSLPQIKFPGIPWFSVINSDAVVSIGSIMGKTRTEPLNIGTFFGKKTDPLGILLYAQNVPFELVINTANMPTIVSMIPGETVHHIKKISSNTNSLADILNHFYVKDLTPHKVFVIDEITHPILGIYLNVIIDVLDPNITTYFSSEQKFHDPSTSLTYARDEIYVAHGELTKDNAPTIATDEERQRYYALLEHYGNKQVPARVPLTSKVLLDVQNHVNALFAHKMTSEEAEKNILKAFSLIPENAALHISKVIGAECPLDNGACWWNMLMNVSKSLPVYTHKILWIDILEIDYVTYIIPMLIDIIIDISRKGVRVFYKDYEGKNPQIISLGEFENLSEDYAPTYKKAFDYFAQHKTLDKSLEHQIEGIEKRSVHQLLTPDAIAKIKEAQEKKITEQKEKNRANPSKK